MVNDYNGLAASSVMIYAEKDEKKDKDAAKKKKTAEESEQKKTAVFLGLNKSFGNQMQHDSRTG